MMRRICDWLGIVMAAALTAPCAAQPVRGDWRYAVFELPPIGGDHSFGWTLDDSGNVVGATFLPGNRVLHATLWVDARTPVDLGTLGGPDSEAKGINNHGRIIGWAQAPGQRGFDASAFLWRDGAMENLGYLAGDLAHAYGINDRDQIVGLSTSHPDGDPHACLWQDGEIIDLGILPGGLVSMAIAINDSGLIVGQANDPVYTTWRPVIWEDGQIIDLGTFRPDNKGTGVAIGVNEAGDVVGYCNLDVFHYRGFIYHDGEKHMLPVEPNWRHSHAWSINDHRQVVGSCNIPGYGNEPLGVLWERGKRPQYLSKLIPPESNWFIEAGLNINNAGQITGTGLRLDNLEQARGYVLSPVKPTMELTSPVPGIAGAENTLSLKGAPAGSEVLFYYSRRGGGTAIDGCRVQQNALQLDEPILIGSVIADENGRARVTHEVPASLRGRAVLMQAAVEEACAVSQLVVYRFE